MNGWLSKRSLFWVKYSFEMKVSQLGLLFVNALDILLIASFMRTTFKNSSIQMKVILFLKRHWNKTTFLWKDVVSLNGYLFKSNPFSINILLGTGFPCRAKSLFSQNFFQFQLWLSLCHAASYSALDTPHVLRFCKVCISNGAFANLKHVKWKH